ncbi:MAG: DinB family protein [Anaerolineae bacterium]
MPSRREFEPADLADWSAHIEKAGAEVLSKLAALPDTAWLEVVEGTWTTKDVIGHLAAWSDYLLDEVEALARGDADAIRAVDIDDWNAVQIAARRDWPAEKVRAVWEATVRRALRVVAQLSADEMTRRRRVAWTDDPVSPADLLELWLLHIEQHRGSLTDRHERSNEREASA